MEKLAMHDTSDFCYIFQKKQLITPFLHYKNGRFFNPFDEFSRRKFRHALLWKLGFYTEPEQAMQAPDDFVYPRKTLVASSSERVRWIGHSTFFIEARGKTLLFDPVWASRVSPFSFIGPKRHRNPCVLLSDLPVVDYVFVSHNHYDHLDKEAISYLAQKNPKTIFFVPLGLKRWFLRHQAKHVVELDWWEQVSLLGDGTNEIRITCVPAQHGSGRRPYDMNKSLWCGFVVEFASLLQGTKKLYFAGDTGYNKFDFKKIGEVFHDIDLSMIPIGAYEPRAFMKPVHVNPKEAVEIHQDVRSKQSIACHFGTYPLADEHHSRPSYDLFLALQKKDIPVSHFRVLHHGEEIFW